jgi:hypothetical protein
MVRYNKELLEECLARDVATLIGEYERYNRDVFIRFKCSCGNEGEKTFRRILLSGGLYCKECCRINTLNKFKITLQYSKILFHSNLIAS